MRYDILLFDIDGTLLDFGLAEKEALRDALSEVGVVADDLIFEDYSKINDSMWKLLEKGELDRETLKVRRFRVLFDKYGIKADPEKMSVAYISALEKKAYLYDGAEELCRELHKKARIYVVTNGTRSVQDSRLKKCGLLPHLDGVFISEKIGFSKPDTRFFDIATASIQDFSKERAVIIGDSLSSDIAGGIAYGIDTVWFNPDGKTAPAAMAEKITFTAKNYGEIYDFLCNGGKE